MGSKTTSQVTNSPNPGALSAYNDVVGKAQAVAGTAYQPYTGELVAGLNQGQQSAINALSGSYGAAQPYIRQGDSMLQAGAQGLGAVQPYLQAGADATAGAATEQGLANTSFGQATGYGNQSAATLAGMSPLIAQSQAGLGAAGSTYGLANQAAANEGAGLGQVGQYLNSAQGDFNSAAGLATPQDFNGPNGVRSYENPYTQDVINTTMAQLNQNDQVQASNVSSSDIGSGAFGGDRNGIAQAALAGQQDMANNSTVAGLNQSNYAQATAQFNATQAQRQAGAQIYSGLGSGELQAGGEQLNTALGYGQQAGTYDQTAAGQTANAMGYNTLANTVGQQASGYAGLGQLANATGSGYNSAGQLALGQAGSYNSLGQLQGTTGQAFGTLGNDASSLGQANESTQIAGASAALQGDTLAQTNQQQQDTAAYNQYMAGLSYPYQQVGFLSNIVQGIGSQEGNTATTQGNALSQVAGLGATSLGILGATGAFGANGYLSGALTSDERVKEDIAPIGKTFDGQTMYRFRYKGDNTTHTGLMAQEVEKKTPDAVMSGLGGIKAVDYDRATAAAARKGRYAAGGSVGLGMRPRFDVGGPIDPTTAPLATFNPSGSALTNGGGLSTNPSALLAGGAGLNMGPALKVAPQPMPQAQGQPQGQQSGQGGGFGSSGGAGLGVLNAAPAPAPASASPSDPSYSPLDGDSSAVAAPQSGSDSNKWMAIMAAGLGMMGGTSMSAAANIGQGGLEGLKMYQGLQQQDRNNAYQQQEIGLKQQSINQTAEEMHQRAKQAQDQLAIQTGTLANQTSTTQSENAVRQAGMITSMPGFDPNSGAPGMWLFDRSNPSAGYKFVAPGQAGTPTPAAPASGGAAPTVAPVSFADPSIAPSATPAPMPAALPPTTSGPAAPVAAPVPVAPPPAAPPAAPVMLQRPAMNPQSGSSLSTSAVPQGWQPTTSVPRGFVPPNQTAISLSPDGGKAQGELGQEEVKTLQTNAAKATNAQSQLYQMNQAIDGLPKSGLLAPGAYGDERAKVANAINGIATTVGAQPVFDPNQAADSQELAKGAFRLGTSMISDTNGAREAGFILQNSVKNVPSINNSYLGFKRVASGIDQANQYAIDKANFVNDYYAKFHHTQGADAAFQQLNPWQNYAQRAIDNSTMPTSRPQGVPQGSQYSMSAKMWRGPDGSLFNQNGQAVQQ